MKSLVFKLWSELKVTSDCQVDGLALQGANFVDVKQLREAIDHFISAYNPQAAPFEWRKSEITR